MNKAFASTACLLVMWACSAHAQEFPVQGSNVSGKQGDTVWLSLTYDYGASFAAIAEDIQFEYQFAGISFNADDSSIGPAGAEQPLPAYIAALRTLAQAHQGGVLVNPTMPAAAPEYMGWALSFQVADGAHERSGKVNFKLAFDILPTALPGPYRVSFTERNLIADADGNEYGYPESLRNLTVTAVPEPDVAWLLPPGLVLVGLRARRRTGHRS